MSVVSSGCCCQKESCPDCCDFWACSPSGPFTIVLTGSWIEQETFSPSNQTITTGEIHWSITATVQRTGNSCATYRYYANSCDFSYEYIQRIWSVGGSDVPTDGSGGGVPSDYQICDRHFRFDLDGDNSYEAVYIGDPLDPAAQLEYDGQYNNECLRSACPCAVAQGVYDINTGFCTCTDANYCRSNQFTCDGSDTARHECFFWNCEAFQEAWADENACNGFGPKPAANILVKVIQERSWVWNVTLQGRPAQYDTNGNLINTGLQRNGAWCNEHQSHWVPGSVITISCKRECDTECDRPILIFNPNPNQVSVGVHTDDLCMGPCMNKGCSAPAQACSTSYNVNLPFIDPWVIIGSGNCMSSSTFEDPITPCDSGNGFIGDHPSGMMYLPNPPFIGIPVFNLYPPSSGLAMGFYFDPSNFISLLNMCGVADYCTPLDRTYRDKKVVYQYGDTTGHSYPFCCTRTHNASVQAYQCVWFNPATQQFVTSTVNEVVCGEQEVVCPEFPSFMGTTEHVITWGFDII
jgi:hypothetical protein